MTAGHGMEWKMEWNGTEISVWNMEDARMEWNGRFQEWNGRQSSILPYQFHTRFCALYLPEVESSRTSLASRTSSRTHFEVLGHGLGLEGQVLGLGLEASSPRKLACPRAEDRPIFEDLGPRGQGKGLQNVALGTSSSPRTSSRTPPLVFCYRFCERVNVLFPTIGEV